MDLGKRFKYFRAKANLTQKEAADLIGINAYQIGNYETNRSEPSITILKKMSKAYKTSIDDLVGNNILKVKLGVIESEEPSISMDEILEKLNELVDQINNREK